MNLAQAIVLLVAAQRLAELVHARRNTARLLAEGGTETGARHYPLFVLLHGGWLVTLYLAAADADEIHWLLIAVFALLQIGRIWVIASLGKYWTTRIVTIPDAPLVARGPYRFMRHPNDAIVIAEIAILPLAFGFWEIALVFSILNLALIAHRVRVENRALAARRST